MTGRLGDWGTGGKIGLTVIIVLSTSVSELSAQSCSTSNASDSAVRVCNSLTHDALVLQPLIGIGLSGGNPVAGASSTLGMRIGSVPRITLAGRFTAAADPRNSEVISSINFDAAVGIFSGLRLFPTIGGFGSLDAVASAGKIYLPDAYSSEDPASWALGVRLGILRESFTAPGVSITGMYRHIGDAGVTRAVPSGALSSYALKDNSVWSVRGVVGKRLFVLGATAGVGYDSYRSDVESHYETSGPLLGQNSTEYVKEGHRTGRLTLFGNVSWTLLILNVVAEGGWQKGGDGFGGPLPAGQRTSTDKSTGYGSFAIRLAL